MFHVKQWGYIIMISGVYGLTGAGKSTFLAWCAHRAQNGKSLQIGFNAAGGVSLQDEQSSDYEAIYSNFPLKGCYPLGWDELGVFFYGNCLILIDEIMMLCDSRAWKTYPENIKYFMSHHRHYHCDIIYCSQSWKDTDIRIRNLAHQFLRIEPFGAFTRITPIIHRQGIRQGIPDDWYEMGGLASARFILRKKYYDMFDSHSTKPLKPLPQKNLWEIIDTETNVLSNDKSAVTDTHTLNAKSNIIY